tara:strand:+ start:47 stop:883 length:837 start_codon:yes stop_codon:yes gene_type:complete
MSKHDLKGMDLSKVGANKDVDFSFKEYMDMVGGGDKKIPKMTDLQQLEDFYGPNELIPGLDKTTGQLKVELQPVGLPKDARILGDGTVLPKGASTAVTKKFADGVNFLDEYLLGGLFEGLRKPVYEDYKKVDLDDLSQYKLLPGQQAKLNTALEQTVGLDPDPTSTMKEAADSYLNFKKKSDTASRKGRVMDSVLEFLNYSLTSPKMFKDLRRETDYAVRRGLQAELRRQSMPDAEQARRIAASAGFATEAQAIAAQQNAATELAKAGIRPSTATFSA